jgi:hypothetical protein
MESSSFAKSISCVWNADMEKYTFMNLIIRFIVLFGTIVINGLIRGKEKKISSLATGRYCEKLAMNLASIITC